MQSSTEKVSTKGPFFGYSSLLIQLCFILSYRSTVRLDKIFSGVS